MAVSGDGAGDGDEENAADPRECLADRPGGGSAEAQRSQRPTMTVIGLMLAKASSHPGMVATGTRVELVKVRMMTGNSPATGSDQIPALETTDGFDELPRRTVLGTCDLTLMPESGEPVVFPVECDGVSGPQVRRI